jgi:hypothetical protein
MKYTDNFKTLVKVMKDNSNQGVCFISWNEPVCLLLDTITQEHKKGCKQTEFMSFPCVKMDLRFLWQ